MLGLDVEALVDFRLTDFVILSFIWLIFNWTSGINITKYHLRKTWLKTTSVIFIDFFKIRLNLDKLCCNEIAGYIG